MSEENLRAVLTDVAERAARYRASVPTRPHRPEKSFAEMQALFDQPVPQRGAPLNAIVSELAELCEPGLAAMVGPRFFGWVIGATEPAGLAADWLASAWGQNTGNAFATPASSACEEVAGRWLLEMLDLPRECSVGFVTGATIANFTCLAAGRNEVMRCAGYDVEADGLYGGPPINVVLGAEAHSTVFSALRYLGLGAKRVIAVDVDKEGRIRAEAFARAIAKCEGPTIAIAQAGHINSGAFDPFVEIADACAKKGAWLHVDGAFGLWARMLPEMAPLTAGLDRADSLATDGHKWLQTPHDCGYAIVKDAAAHKRAMRIAASYLPDGDVRHPGDYVPELSRRARGFSTWAMLKSLGREGVAAMVRRHCAQARRIAERLARDPDVEIMNEVVLNQVAVRLGRDMDGPAADALTQRTIDRIQREGECFVGGAIWHDRLIIRISVISAPTTDADIDRSADAILSAWHAERGANA